MQTVKSVRYKKSIATLMLSLALTACTGTNAPLGSLFSAKKPTTTIPTATNQQRATALNEVAVKLEQQKASLQKENHSQQQVLSTAAIRNSNAAKQLTKKRASLLVKKPAVPSAEIVLAKLTPAGPIVQPKERATPTIEPNPSIEPIISGSGPLGRFHAKLKAIEEGKRKKPLTILHIGDSHVASDSFSRGIRNELQSRYGHAGRGMVLPASAFKYGVADQVRLSSSGNWRPKTALRSKSGPFGISGVNLTSRSSKSSMTMTSQKGFDWAEVTVLSGPSQGRVTMKVGAVSKKFNAWSKTKGSKTFRLDAKGNRLEVRPGGGAQTTVLSWGGGKNRPGVRYVNFGLIGATVDITRRFDKRLVANDIKRLDPDLIVYGYGTNEGFKDNLNIRKYKAYANSFMEQMRTSAPNADMVFIGAASGLRKRGKRTCGSWAVPPKLAPVRKAVREIAAKQNGAYWDWSAAMGGKCGINTWASQKLASRDRVHLTNAGYRKSASAFVEWLTAPAQSNVAVASK